MGKKLLCSLCAAMLMAILIPSSYAVELFSVSALTASVDESTIIPYADVIVYKYRIYNGKYQYRRWNETRGYWVDPYWMDAPQ